MYKSNFYERYSILFYSKTHLTPNMDLWHPNRCFWLFLILNCDFVLKINKNKKYFFFIDFLSPHILIQGVDTVIEISEGRVQQCDRKVPGMYVSQHGTLVICKIDFQLHTGTFECNATNKVDSTNERMELIIEGGKNTFECIKKLKISDNLNLG